MKIVRRLEVLRRREHQSTVAIVEALVACHRSKAHVDLGYPTIWQFLVGHLNYSNAAASRRYRAMQVAERFPEVLAMLRQHQVHLSTLAMVAPVLGEVDDPRALLARIVGMSQPQVEREIARVRPAARPREMVRATFVRTAAGTGSVARTSAAEVDRHDEAATRSAAELTSHARHDAAATSAAELPLFEPTPTSAAEPTARVEELVTLRFSIGAGAYAEFERARAIVSRKTGGCPSLEECFLEFMRFYAKQKSPRVRRAPHPGSAQATSKARPEDLPAKPARRTRHIPAALRDEVMLRDGQRCTYVGPDGHRCAATLDLELDHIRPFARGGAHTAANLRVLCGAHNRRRLGVAAASADGAPSPPGSTQT